MNVDFADEEMIAYRESLIEKKKEQPLEKRNVCRINETAAYTGIGRGKIRELMKRKDCNFMTDRRLSGVCHHRQICGIFK